MKIIKKDIDEVIPNDILGGKVNSGRDFNTGKEIIVEGGDRNYQEEIEKIPESERVKEVIFTNPVTGKTDKQIIDLRGTTDEKLSLILNDKGSDQTQKDAMMSLYLFERGRESSSFITDLFVYKGQHTKETRKFMSTVRSDLDLFAGMIANSFSSIAQSYIDNFLPGESATSLEDKAGIFIKDHKDQTYLVDSKEMSFGLKEFIKELIDKKGLSCDEYRISMIEIALKHASQAVTINEKIRSIADEREKAAGKPH